MITAPAFPAPLTFRESPQRILVVITRRIGDVLLATPVLRSLKDAWPQADIDVLVFAGTQGFLMGNPDVHRVIAVPERSGMLAQLKRLWGLSRRYDLALSLLPGDRPTLYAWIGGRRSVGLQVADRQSAWKRWLLDAWVPFDGADTHTVRMHLALLASIGVAPAARVLACWTPEDERLVDTLLAPLEKARFAVLHPYPKFRYKMWTAAGWTTVGTWLREQELEVVFTGGPGPDEQVYNEMIARRIEGALDLTGKLGLGAVALVLARAAVYVGPDTAITHAAAALGVPTVALFGPTNPMKWGPWPSGHPLDVNPWVQTGSQANRHVRLIQGEGVCVPCGQEGCERHIESSSDCLTSLPAERVIDGIRDLI